MHRAAQLCSCCLLRRCMTMVAAALLPLCASVPLALTQTLAHPADKEATHDRLIIVKVAQAHTLLSTFAHRTEGHLEMTGSEVWAVPKSQSAILLKHLNER